MRTAIILRAHGQCKNAYQLRRRTQCAPAQLIAKIFRLFTRRREESRRRADTDSSYGDMRIIADIRPKEIAEVNIWLGPCHADDGH